MNSKRLANFTQAFASPKSDPIHRSGWLDSDRKEAFHRLSELDFPTTKDECWRYTSVEALDKIRFQPVDERIIQTVKREDIEPFYFGQQDWIRLVFINGFFAAHLSAVSKIPDGLMIGNLATLDLTGFEKAKHDFGHFIARKKNVFAALNAAFSNDGAFICVSDGLEIDEPIHLVFLTSAGSLNLAVQPRIFILMNARSKAKVIESYVSLDEGIYLTNAVTEIVLKDGAELEHYKFGRESPGAFHIGSTDVNQGRESIFFSSSAVLSGGLIRNNLNVGLGGEHCSATLDGFYYASGRSHIDNHTSIDHFKSNGTSRQLYKGIVDDSATAVFGGKIFVHPGAKKTDASQTNKNLILSDEAVVNTKPQLEIFDDDVKCTHGAAVGQLDNDAIFYLKSRGVGGQEARRILSYAFAGEVASRIRIDAMRAQLESLLFERLSKKPTVKVEG